MSLITRPRYADALVEYRIEFPEAAAALDVVLTPSQATENYITAYFNTYQAFTITTELAQNVTSFTVSVSPDVPTTTTVGISMTVSQDNREMTLRSAVGLRADWTNRLGWVSDGGWPDGGYWVLVN